MNRKNSYVFHRVSILVITLTLIIGPGCYHFYIEDSSNPDPATETRTTTVNSYLWGLIQEDFVCHNCDTLGLHLQEVRITTNFGYAMLTIATLGIWCPLQVEWRCAKPPKRIGDF